MDFSREEKEKLFMGVQLAIFKIAGDKNGEDSDMVADLRCHLWEQMKFFDPSRSTFFAFAYTVLVNHKLSSYRRKQLSYESMREYSIKDRQHSATESEVAEALKTLKEKIGDRPYDLWWSDYNNPQPQPRDIRELISRVESFILCGGIWEDWGWKDTDVYVGQRPRRRKAKCCHPRETYSTTPLEYFPIVIE